MQNTLIVASPHPITLIVPIVENFENESGIDVTVVQSGTGEIISELLRYPDTSMYDVLWGGSYTSVLPFSSFFENYQSIHEDSFPDSYKNKEGMITRFSDVPSILMINKNLLGSIKVTGYEDLLNPLLKGQIAFANPESSSSSWEHLINMLYVMGNGNPENGWSYVEALCKNMNGIFLNGSHDVYDSVSKGQYAVGLTFEEGAANFSQNDDNISIVYMKEGVVFTPDGVYLLRNSSHEENAKKFIDYVTGKAVQNYIAQELNRRPIRADVSLKQFLPPKESIKSVQIDYETASKKHKEWIDHILQFTNNGEKQ